MTKLFSPTFKQQCVDLMLKQHHTIAQVSKMMSVSTSALQRRGEQYLRAIKYYVKQIGRYFEIHRSTLLCWKKAKADWNVSGLKLHACK